MEQRGGDCPGMSTVDHPCPEDPGGFDIHIRPAGRGDPALGGAPLMRLETGLQPCSQQSVPCFHASRALLTIRRIRRPVPRLLPEAHCHCTRVGSSCVAPRSSRGSDPSVMRRGRGSLSVAACMLRPPFAGLGPHTRSARRNLGRVWMPLARMEDGGRLYRGSTSDFRHPRPSVSGIPGRWQASGLGWPNDEEMANDGPSNVSGPEPRG